MKARILAIAIAIACTGCATQTSLTPKAERYAESSQKKPLAVQHWAAIADDVSIETRRVLDQNDFLNQRAFYVAPGNSAFEQAFSKFMISRLLAKGIPVASQPQGAVAIQYEVQVVQHKLGFNPSEQSYIPGTATAGVAGLWILRDAALHASRETWIAGTVGVAAAYDIYKYMNKDNRYTSATDTELVISTSIADGGRYKMHKTDAYYIEDAEIGLFENSVFAKSWGVVQ